MSFDSKEYWEERLKRHYDLEGVGCEGRSKAWNDFFYKSKVRAMDRALNKLGLDIRGYKAIDVGTGVGFWIDYLLEKSVNSITGVDITSSSIEFCNRKYSNLKNLKFINGDISDDNFVSEELLGGGDLLTIFDVLYHITDDNNFCAAIKNIADTLKPGGYLFLTDILSSSREIKSQQEHVRWRSLSYYRQKLDNNGFDIIYLSPMTVLLGSPVDSGDLLGKILNVIYYGLTTRLTSKSKTFPRIERTYLTVLYNLDSGLALFPKFGVSTKLLVAKKRS